MSEHAKLTLVTGSAGFIGRHVTPLLTGDRRSIRRATHRPGPDADTVVDVNAHADWTDALVGVDRVLHLAGMAHLRRDPSNDPLAEYRRVNVDGTMALARQAAAAGVRRFVYVSSAGVFGTAADHPLSEDAPVAPQTPYAVSKVEAEQQLLAMSGPMSVVVVRPPLVYGVGAPGNFGRLVNLVSRGWPLPLGRAVGRRSIVFVENLASALVACLESPAAAGQVFHVTDGADVTSAELARALASAMGRPPRVFPVPPGVLRLVAAAVGRSDDYERLFGNLQLDASRIGTLLGWKPPYTMEDGLARVVAGVGEH